VSLVSLATPNSPCTAVPNAWSTSVQHHTEKIVKFPPYSPPRGHAGHGDTRVKGYAALAAEASAIATAGERLHARI
jgi:hypothetical protein